MGLRLDECPDRTRLFGHRGFDRRPQLRIDQQRKASGLRSMRCIEESKVGFGCRQSPKIVRIEIGHVAGKNETSALLHVMQHCVDPGQWPGAAGPVVDLDSCMLDRFAPTEHDGVADRFSDGHHVIQQRRVVRQGDPMLGCAHSP